MLDEWISAVKDELGIDLDVDTGILLDLARDAAHGVARPAAPLTTFLVGYAAAQGKGGPEAVAEASRKAAALALRWADEDTQDAPSKRGPAPGPGAQRVPRPMRRRPPRVRTSPDDRARCSRRWARPGCRGSRRRGGARPRERRQHRLRRTRPALPATAGHPADPHHRAPPRHRPAQGHPLARGPRDRRPRRTLRHPPGPRLRDPRRRPRPRPGRTARRPQRPALVRHLGDGRLGGRGPRPLGRTRGRGARRARAGRAAERRRGRTDRDRRAGPRGRHRRHPQRARPHRRQGPPPRGPGRRPRPGHPPARPGMPQRRPTAARRHPGDPGSARACRGGRVRHGHRRAPAPGRSPHPGR